MKKFLYKLNQKFCDHDFQPVRQDMIADGTLASGMRPAQHVVETYQCARCGMIAERSFVYFRGMK